jgi:hypothetical protein
MEPNNRAGELRPCPGCGHGFVVPPAPTRKRGRDLWPILAIVGIFAVALGIPAGRWAYQASRPGALQRRLATVLPAYSPEWGGIAWEVCQPGTGEYRLMATHPGRGGVYTFGLSRAKGGTLTVIRVNPRKTAPEWLVLAVFDGLRQDTFEYRGWDDAERNDLQILVRQLADAFGQAIE